MSSEHWASSLIGQPWSEERNCWWLVREVFLTRFGLELPVIDVGQAKEDQSHNIREVTAVGGWRPVEDPNPAEWDIALMRGPMGAHVGVVIQANGRLGLLHSTEGFGVTFQSIHDLGRMGYSRPQFWRR